MKQKIYFKKILLQQKILNVCSVSIWLKFFLKSGYNLKKKNKKWETVTLHIYKVTTKQENVLSHVLFTRQKMSKGGCDETVAPLTAIFRLREQNRPS